MNKGIYELLNTVTGQKNIPTQRKSVPVERKKNADHPDEGRVKYAERNAKNPLKGVPRRGSPLITERVNSVFWHCSRINKGERSKSTTKKE